MGATTSPSLPRGSGEGWSCKMLGVYLRILGLKVPRTLSVDESESTITLVHCSVPVSRPGSSLVLNLEEGSTRSPGTTLYNCHRKYFLPSVGHHYFSLKKKFKS